MNKSGRNKIKQRSAVSRKLLMQYVISIIGYVVGVMLFVFVAWRFCMMFIWQPDDPLYILLQTVKEYIILFLGITFLIGWVFITYYFISKPLRYLDEVVVAKWIKKQCQEYVQQVCESVYPKFQKYGVEFPVLRLRNMVSRWGSCQPKRKILTFNIALIEAPLSCIEYVATHEFVHFLQPNHSRKFYQYLSMFMPDWKERKSSLEKTYNYFE